MNNLVTTFAFSAVLALGLASAWPKTAEAASPAATVQYVQNVASNVLQTAKSYTDGHVPEIDLTPYAKKNDLPYRTDTATNVLWKVVVSNGYFFAVAYTNTVSTGASR